MTFNGVFKKTHSTKRRYVVLKGSAGSGKSRDTAMFLLLRLLRDEGRNLMCIRKIEDANRDSTFAELCGVIESAKLSHLFKISQSPLQITCHNGNRIIFRGVHDTRAREKLKSISFSKGKLTDIWIEEATELLQSDFEIIDDRLRGKLPSPLFYQIRLTLNPVSAHHWIKKRFFDSPSRSVLTHSSTYLDNKFIDSDFHMRMEERKLHDPEGYRIYGLGDWGETEGLVLPNYKVLKQEMNSDDFDSLAYGQDFGFNHANAILLLGYRDGNVYVLEELISRGMTTQEIIAIAQDRGFSKKIPMYCDSAEPDRILSWRRAGFLARPVVKGAGSVAKHIDFLRGCQILISPKCKHCISEISAWKFELDRVTGAFSENPVNANDDAMAALRYGTQAWRQGDALRPTKRSLGL